MIVIIDYGMGNIGSLQNMIRKLGHSSDVTSDLNIINKADKLILPGVGAFDNGINSLNGTGILQVLTDKIINKKTPILCICLGMQLITKASEEGTLPGLGWIDAYTVRFKFNPDINLKIPHMGWNEIIIQKDSPIFKDMYEDPCFYFVHSYHLVCNSKSDVLSTTFYGYDFVSSIQKDNIIATQFHPEKSHKYGLKLVKNFLELM